MFVKELPLTAAPLEAIGLAYDHIFRIAILEHDMDLLNRADDPHVAVDRNLLIEDVDLAGFEGAEYAVEHLQRGRDAP